jgi:hypothetical protein
MEEWRDIVGFEGLYEVSNFGRVRHKNGQEIGGSLNSYGYRAYSLFKDGKRYTGKGHRLVAEAFIPNPEGKRNVNHKDGDRDNNFVDNLEWVTHGENGRHARQELCIDYSVKPVAQITPNGNVVAIWLNASIASRLLGISSQLISACCRGTAKSTGDYMWRFAELSFERGVKEVQADILREKLSTLAQELSTLEKELA